MASLPEQSNGIGMTADEFNQQVLQPLRAEARKRRFILKLDPVVVQTRESS